MKTEQKANFLNPDLDKLEIYNQVFSMIGAKLVLVSEKKINKQIKKGKQNENKKSDT